MSAYSIATTTVDSQQAADAIIARVLDEKLAACVQVFPVTSHYIWQGERRQDLELLLQMKIKTADWDALRETIRAAHPYDTPQIVRIPIEAGHAPYLTWIDDVTR
ncbi:MAG: divalent-cation tolerance protein CutA [Beijerinckiaceae bacterium]